MKYNYVIFQPFYDYYEVSYYDVIGHENVQFINQYPAYGCACFKKICQKHRSSKYNRFFKLPFQSIWNPLFFKDTFEDGKPICFVFSAGMAYLESYHFIQYLKSKYYGSKFVCFYQDIVDSVNNYSFEDAQNVFDLIISYDKVESSQRNIVFHNTVYSKYPIPLNESVPESDVYFVGAAKNRLGEIIEMYEILSAYNLKCDFNIIGVTEEDRKYSDSIHYVSHMSYIENLQHVVKCKAILEVMQKNAVGASLRVWESIMYDKHLLTNNPGLLTLDFYNPEFMHIYDNTKPKTFHWLNKEVFYNDDTKDQLNPYKLLEFIDSELLKLYNY